MLPRLAQKADAVIGLVFFFSGYNKKISDETATEIGIKGFAYKPVVKLYPAKTVRKVLNEADRLVHD